MPPSPRRFVSSGAMVLDLETMNPLLNFQPTGADYSILADGGDARGDRAFDGAVRASVSEPALANKSTPAATVLALQAVENASADPRLLTRTDYFPGLGWMIEKRTWDELRGRWPARPTTGWDHWFRLSTTSRGRECVVRGCVHGWGGV